MRFFRASKSIVAVLGFYGIAAVVSRSRGEECQGTVTYDAGYTVEASIDEAGCLPPSIYCGGVYVPCSKKPYVPSYGVEDNDDKLCDSCWIEYVYDDVDLQWTTEMDGVVDEDGILSDWTAPYYSTSVDVFLEADDAGKFPGDEDNDHGMLMKDYVTIQCVMPNWEQSFLLKDVTRADCSCNARLGAAHCAAVDVYGGCAVFSGKYKYSGCAGLDFQGFYVKETLNVTSMDSCLLSLKIPPNAQYVFGALGPLQADGCNYMTQGSQDHDRLEMWHDWGFPGKAEGTGCFSRVTQVMEVSANGSWYEYLTTNDLDYGFDANGKAAFARGGASSGWSPQAPW